MEFTGTELINADPEKVFDFLTDSHQIADCAPLMQDVKINNDDEFEFKLSASGFMVTFTVRWTERRKPDLARSTVEGGNRMIGKAILQNELRIAGEGDGPSQVIWSTEATVTGMISNMVDEAQIATLVGKLNGDVIDCIRQKIE